LLGQWALRAASPLCDRAGAAAMALHHATLRISDVRLELESKRIKSNAPQ
jgi:hypothetical protein